MKKDIEMSRKVDELGRIVIPKEIRDKFGIKTNDRMDIYVENNVISLVKDSHKCIFCSSTKDLIDVPINPDELYRIERQNMILKDYELIAICMILDIDYNDLIKVIKKKK